MRAILLFRFVVRFTIIWSLYLQQVDVLLGSLALLFVSKLIYTTVCNKKSWAYVYKRLSYVLTTAALGLLIARFEANSTWFYDIADLPHYFLYASAAFYAAASFAKITVSAQRGIGVHTAIYRVRKFIYNTYSVVAFCTTLYYATSVIKLLEKKSNVHNMTLLETTNATNFTISACKTKDQKDELLDSLYDTTEFTLECAYDVWRRNRINLLAWLQVKIVFGLTWRLQHYKAKLNRLTGTNDFHRVQASGMRVLVMTLSQVVKYIVLFFAITLWFDNIVEWYVMPASTATLLTIFVYIEDVYERYIFTVTRPRYVWFGADRTNTNVV